MLSFHVKFEQTDRRMDGQQLNNMPPIFRYRGIKMYTHPNTVFAKDKLYVSYG